jgi:hypothetical protein
MTLLEMTQNILSSMDSDEVNSIGDTVESLQVAEIIRETYWDITENSDIPGMKGLISLTPSTDPDRPNVLTVPDDGVRVDWIRYNNKLVQYLKPDQFVQYVLYQEDTDGVVTVDRLPVRTDFDPIYWTSFNDSEMFFSSYNSDEDSTLQQAKAMCWGTRNHTFSVADTFVPDLPSELFPMFLAEAKNACFVNFKQVANSNEQRKATRQNVRWQNNKHKSGYPRPIDRLPNYGRSR